MKIHGPKQWKATFRAAKKRKVNKRDKRDALAVLKAFYGGDFLH